MWLFRASIFASLCLTAACAATASEHSDIDAMIKAKTLPFPGEIPLIFIEQSEPGHSVAIVKSCAPFPEGCKPPQLKARSIRYSAPGTYVWEFADLRNCQGTDKLVEALSIPLPEARTDAPEEIKYRAGPHLVKSAREHAAEDLVTRLTSCLTKSYMTPPWQR